MAAIVPLGAKPGGQVFLRPIVASWSMAQIEGVIMKELRQALLWFLDEMRTPISR
jgi:hypothetical protein